MQVENWITIKEVLHNLLILAPLEREEFLKTSDLSNEVKNEVAIVIYGEKLPSQTMTLGLSKRGEYEISARSILTDKLYVPSEYAIQPEETLYNQPIIKLQKNFCRTSLS